MNAHNFSEINNIMKYITNITYPNLPPNPSVHPWPQSPLFIKPGNSRASKRGETRILGIRYESESAYESSLYTSCNSTMIEKSLPINNGKEFQGKNKVVDFESDWFRGSVLFRIKNSNSLFEEDVCSNCKKKGNYFANKKRTFQVLIKGKFLKNNIKMSDCITGQSWDKPLSIFEDKKMQYLVNIGKSVAYRLSPQLTIKIPVPGEKDSETHLYSPLISTAQVIKVNTNTDEDQYFSTELGQTDHEEPHSTDPTSILHYILNNDSNNHQNGNNSVQNQKLRKKIFNSIYANAHSPTSKYDDAKDVSFSTEHEYTFEFYQHMIDFDDFHIQLPFKKYPLSSVLNHQPLNVMAGFYSGEDLRYLWNFEIWHEIIYPHSEDNNVLFTSSIHKGEIP